MDKTTFPAMPEREATYVHCPQCTGGRGRSRPQENEGLLFLAPRELAGSE
jgi:hypothetical protein